MSAAAWRAEVVTLFPEAFPGVLGLSLTGKALTDGLWSLQTIGLRDFGLGRHRNVDDTPAGGGAGMVMRADVMDAALGRATPGLPVIPTTTRPPPDRSRRARTRARSTVGSATSADGCASPGTRSTASFSTVMPPVSRAHGS